MTIKFFVVLVILSYSVHCSLSPSTNLMDTNRPLSDIEEQHILNSQLAKSELLEIKVKLLPISKTEIRQAVTFANHLRSSVVPKPKRMNCLTWDSALSKIAESKALKCNVESNDESAAIAINLSLLSLVNIFLKWSMEGLELSVTTGCIGISCKNHNLLFGDGMDSFGCATSECPRPGLDSTYNTICEFNNVVNRTYRLPYVVNSDEHVCVDCIPSKSICKNNLCCSDENESIESSETSSPTNVEEFSWTTNSNAKYESTLPRNTKATNSPTTIRKSTLKSEVTPKPVPPTEVVQVSTRSTTATTSGLTRSEKSHPEMIPEPTPSIKVYRLSTIPQTRLPTITTSKMSPSSETLPTAYPYVRRCIPIEFATTTEKRIPTDCKDISNSSLCTSEFCQRKPFVALQQCKKTCNNCDGCSCYDSDIPTGKGGRCKQATERMCVVKDVAEKCPTKCNRCSEILDQSCPTCQDSYDKCSATLCDEMPGNFYPLCKKTCNNCNGCKCFDSKRPPTNCLMFLAQGSCVDPKLKIQARTYCPKTCQLCSHVTIEPCPGSCTDNIENCSLTKCNSEPGEYLTKCRRTCDNCDGCACRDSTSSTIDCLKFKTQGNCTTQMDAARRFCPMTCNRCVNDQSTSQRHLSTKSTFKRHLLKYNVAEVSHAT